MVIPSKGVIFMGNFLINTTMEEDIIKEGCEETNCAKEVHPAFPLWIIHYFVRGHCKYKGFAIVKAPDCHTAETIFRSKSAHNGNQENLKVAEIKEVYYLPCPDLLAEEYMEDVPPPLPPKRKIGKTKHE